MNTPAESPKAEPRGNGTPWETYAFAALAAILAVVQRLLPPPLHPLNMTMFGALGLWGGARLPLMLGLGLPVAVWAATDIVLLLTTGYPAFNPFVYAAFLCYAGLGSVGLRRRATFTRIAGFSVLGSTLFFLITNFGQWLGSRVDPETVPAGQHYAEVQGQYPLPMIRYSDNVQGLLTCYAFALPFWGQDPAGREVPAPMGFAGNALVGDLAFTGALFGLHALVLSRVGRRRPVPVVAGS